MVFHLVDTFFVLAPSSFPTSVPSTGKFYNRPIFFCVGIIIFVIQ